MDIITIALLFILVFLAFVYLIRSKIMGVLAVILKFGFPALAVLLLVALFIPSVFNTAADFTLKQNGTYDQITQFDDTLSPILELPSNLLVGLDDLFGGSDTEEVPDTDGLLEENLYPTIVTLVGGILRLVTIAFCVLGMVAIIYLSYTLEGSLSAHAMKQKVKTLEQRVASLEAQLTVQASP